MIHTSPPPDDAKLSPLRDGRAQQFRLYDLTAKQTLGTSRYDPPTAEQTPQGELPLGTLNPWQDHTLSLELSGNSGQQVLGLALARNTSWQLGADSELTFQMRRPLMFFGGSPKLVAPIAPPQASFAPNGQLSPSLRSETKLRVVDPNAIEPLLLTYDREFPGPGGTPSPVTAAAGTRDGQSLLAATLGGSLYVVDTLQFSQHASVPIDSSLPPQVMVVGPQDRSAILLQYAIPAAAAGRVGRLTFYRDLAGLRSRVSDGSPLALDIMSSSAAPLFPPIAATYASDGNIDILFSQPPLGVDAPDCDMLAAGTPTTLRRYSPEDGQIITEEKLPYTTALQYTQAGERVLVQPCIRTTDGKRPGRIVVEKSEYNLTFVAPGSINIAPAGEYFVSFGMENVVDDRGASPRAALRILNTAREEYYVSHFAMQSLLIPFNITSGIPHAVSIIIAPTEVQGYSISVSPDLTRALVLSRVRHRTFPTARGVFIYNDDNANMTCYMKYAGQQYHVNIINLETGAREQDYVVGIENQSCRATLYNDTTGNDTGMACFSACSPGAGWGTYLDQYRDGYIPSAATALFGQY